MNRLKYILTMAVILIAGQLMAQPDQVEMADGFRAEGKIYVVIGVMSIILIGLAVYLFTMDRKLNKLEKALDQLES